MSSQRERVWRKSSRSGTQGDCVEVADFGNAVRVRDSKNPGGGYLSVPVESFAHLLTRVKRGELNP